MSVAERELPYTDVPESLAIPMKKGIGASKPRSRKVRAVIVESLGVK